MSNWQRFTFGSDLHGDMQSLPVLDAFWRFDAEWKPAVRIFGGDLCDLRPLRTGASEEERRETMQHDVRCGIDFLQRWRPNYWLLGNHDFRLWDWASRGNGAVSELAGLGVKDLEAKAKRLRCDILPYDKRDGILRLGRAKFLHGFFCGETAAKRHALIYGACMFGHTHAIEEAPIAGLERRVARGVGCLCQLNHDYNSRTPSSLRHANGWAYGVINKTTGEYVTWQAEEIGGTWLLATRAMAV